MRFAKLIVVGVLLHAGVVHGATYTPATAADIRTAIVTAQAGDVIDIAAGNYQFTSNIVPQNGGTSSAPILITASGGAVKLNFSSQVGLQMNQPYWIVEKVWINGNCNPISQCATGLQVKWNADNLIVRNIRMTNYYQHIKSSGRQGSKEVHDVTIEASEFYNEVQNGGTPIDIVAGVRWRIVGNYVHDFGGAPPDYGIFLKGVTRDGLIERNLVICTKDYNWPGATVGISFGGGGTGSQFCPNNDCSCEDIDSIARNNIVMNCTDAGLHTKRACGSKFYHNTVINVLLGLQIQIDGAGQPVDVRHNVFDHHIVGQNNVTESNNLFDLSASQIAGLYADIGTYDFSEGSNSSVAKDAAARLADVTTDYCGNARPQTGVDYGAIEFPAGCTTWPWNGVVMPTPTPPDAGPIPADGGTSTRDSGSAAADAGPGPIATDAGTGPGIIAPDLSAGPAPNNGQGTLEGGCSIGATPSLSLVLLLLLSVRIGRGLKKRRHFE